jgi:putative DNA primase/helicase
VSIETNKGTRIAEGLVKMLTGGDRVRARKLHENSFEFKPSCKLFLAANDAPRASSDDDAYWERMKVLPFAHTVPAEQRRESVKRLLTTDPECLEAVLAWAVFGCLDWQQNGLLVPDTSAKATDEYRASQNPLAEFLDEECALESGSWASTRSLWERYDTWSKQARIKFPLTSRKFTNALKASGLQPEKMGEARGWSGIRLQDHEQNDSTLLEFDPIG